MKIVKNILKILLIITTLFSTSIVKQPVSAATTPIDSAYLYEKSSYGSMLKYNGVEVLTTFVVYAKGSVEYPAYCLDKDTPGVGENGSYTVDTTSYLNDVMLWRVITNGYPYKTVAELGCSTKEEAYAATKQAVYCMLYGREAAWYTPIGESGTRVLNAMIKILQNAKSSTATKPSSDITIKSLNNKWEVDTKNSNYVSQTFEVLTSSTGNNCSIFLTGNYPEGTKIVNSNNNIINTVTSGGTFKIIMPIKSLKSDGEFEIKAHAELVTKPVLYGKAPNSSLQDYAVTASVYEQGRGSATISYKENETKIIIQKQDTDNKKPLAGVTFQILDANKKLAYTDLISDSNGRIEINNVLPGKYYIEEVKTNEGYTKYDKQITCNLTFNQTLTVTVNNTKTSITELESNNQEITVEQNDSEIKVNNQNSSTNIEYNNQNTEIKDLNTNTNEVTVNKNIDINNENKNVNTNNTNTEVNVENKSENVNSDVAIDDEYENTNINNINNTVNINNKNENTNINNTNSEISLYNENKNTNINNTDNTLNVNDKNENVNINNNKQDLNINNSNENTNINNQNINSNIQNLNGVVKLPKTGM